MSDMQENKVHPSMDELAIGHQIRDLRRAKRLTLTELSETIGKSVGYISQIERGKSSVTIPVLQDISAALGVQASWFFSGQANAPKEERDFIVRKENRKTLDLSSTGLTEELLSPNLSGSLEFLLTTYQPGAGTGDRPRQRKGEEAGLILQGLLDITINGKTFSLREGDSFSLPDKGEHACVNPGDENLVIAWVITPPNY
ncbi:helix-turn-helix domain-containing protein [Sneathiella aquimaris]|uniref:helix-turn-helix domain-containing protein n=1 Tax=Sneathiella aquimaris TaxID=2599305 RepID=UPI00146A0278|nr:helix-turn-helix domain-containing protein [Sneathiella aquimaris]